MANQNLSQFGEKLFVADADHTFIWDSTASISKRVSRNSWLNSGTLTSDAPVTISQTWNNAAVAFTGLKVDATNTNSAAASKLLDLQVGGASLANFSKAGHLIFPSSSTVTPSGPGVGQWVGTLALFGTGGSLLVTGSSSALNISGNVLLSWNNDTILLRDGAANTLALRNGANTQTFNVYGSYGSISDYKRLSISCDQTTGNATITNQAAGYTAGTVSINGVPVGRGKGSVDGNIAIGSASLNSFSTGFLSIAIGADALKLITASQHNTAIGGNTLSKITSGNNNTSIGSNSMQAITSGSDNTSLGLGTFEFLTSGSNNVIIGSLAGKNTAASASLTTCNNSILIGNATRVELIGQTNQIVIGDQATGIGSNSVVLGNDSITKTALKGNVGIGTTSPTSKLHVEGNALITGNVSLSNGSVTVLGTRGFTLTPADGIFQFLNNAQTGFDRIQLGGASTGHPAIKRNGASIDITLASDGITFTSIQDLYRRFGAGSPEGVVVAPTGAVYHNTNGGAATTFYVKESSPTPSTGWVGK